MMEALVAGADTDPAAKRGPARADIDGVDGKLVAELVEQARAAGL